MRGEQKSIGLLEAKTRLSELTRETARGRSFLIRKRGRPVALLSAPPPTGTPDLDRLLEGFRSIRSRVKRGVSARRLIEEGRRF